MKKLRFAHIFAGVIGLPLNVFVTVTPFRSGERDGAHCPADEFAASQLPRRLDQASRLTD